MKDTPMNNTHTFNSLQEDTQENSMQNLPLDTVATNNSIPAELTRVGRQHLTDARSVAMSKVAEELRALQPLMVSGGSVPEGTPAWAATAFVAAGMKDGWPCWNTLRKHLAKRTANLIADSQLAEQITGESLARFLGLDLYSMAYEGWAEIEATGPAAQAGGAANHV